MHKLLLPVDGSRNSEFAVKHVVKQFMNDSGLEIHLLNVQSPFSRDVARFVSGKSLRDYHRDRAESALQPVKRILDEFGVPYSAHYEVGRQAKVIADAARRLRCDRIVISTARKNSLTRLLENSVTNQLLELTPVPVEVIAGDSISKLERWGLPAALGTALALLLFAAD